MTDITPLASIATAGDTSRLASRDNLAKAGKQFEAIFTGMMLKSMRQAKLGDSLFQSKALDTFRDMQDQRLAESMAEHQPIGIGRAMTEFLARNQAGLQGPDAP
jgi:peptidoglycan hydrolase FlgJ